MKKIGCLFICLCLLSVTYGVQAAFITFDNEIVLDTGTGWGNVLQTLALQQHGSATSESGSVTWNGTADVLTGDAKPQSQTVTVAQINSEGFDASDLIVILNLNQTGSHPELDVHSFTMRFYTNPAGSSYFDAVYDINDVRNTGSTLGLAPQVQGLGTGQAGYVFRINFEGTEAADFFASDDHRLGMLVLTPMDNEANAGADGFYMADADTSHVIPVPEPATLIVLLIGLALSGFSKRSLFARRPKSA